MPGTKLPSWKKGDTLFADDLNKVAREVERLGGSELSAGMEGFVGPGGLVARPAPVEQCRVAMTGNLGVPAAAPPNPGQADVRYVDFRFDRMVVTNLVFQAYNFALAPAPPNTYVLVHSLAGMWVVQPTGGVFPARAPLGGIPAGSPTAPTAGDCTLYRPGAGTAMVLSDKVVSAANAYRGSVPPGGVLVWLTVWNGAYYVLTSDCVS